MSLLQENNHTVQFHKTFPTQNKLYDFRNINTKLITNASHHGYLLYNQHNSFPVLLQL